MTTFLFYGLGFIVGLFKGGPLNNVTEKSQNVPEIL